MSEAWSTRGCASARAGTASFRKGPRPRSRQTAPRTSGSLADPPTDGSVEQVQQLVRIAREFGRPVATAAQAREIYRIGTFYRDADQTLAENGFAPNRRPFWKGVPTPA